MTAISKIEPLMAQLGGDLINDDEQVKQRIRQINACGFGLIDHTVVSAVYLPQFKEKTIHFIADLILGGTQIRETDFRPIAVKARVEGKARSTNTTGSFEIVDHEVKRLQRVDWATSRQ